MSRCTLGNSRHWFTAYGAVGLRTPICQRYGCEAKNPRPLTNAELSNYEYWKKQGWVR